MKPEKIAWKKVPRVALPQHERGADWSRDRRLVLDAGHRGRVFVVPGHTSWVSRGSSGYYEAKLVVEYHSQFDRLMDRTLLEGGRFSRERLNAPEVIAQIAEYLDLRAQDLPSLDARFSWVPA